MADAEVQDLTELTDPATNNVMHIIDDPGGTPVSKKITLANLFNLPAIADPAAPGADRLRLYAKNVSGRMMPKWIGPSGIDTVVQPALFGNNIVFWTPNTGTVGTGVPWGSFFTSAGTVSHPTPASSGVAITNQMRRTRWANVVTTTNQELGTKAVGTGLLQFWRGNAAGLGGFFFTCRFITELVPATTIRLFVGLASQTGSMVSGDTVTGDLCGLHHITTDNITTMAFVTRDNTTTTRATFTVPTIAAGNGYDFYMFCAPNGGTIYYRLVNLSTGLDIVNSSTSTTLPRNTIFMGPHVVMSNGTANLTVTTTAIGINRIYIESDN